MIQGNCVVLADVVDSRKIEDRDAFENRLREAISTVNGNYREHIQADFNILKGIDEFGGIITSISPIADIQKTFSRALYPEQFRMVAVVGEIDVNEFSEYVSQMDGPVFARGDTALREIEESGYQFRLSSNRPYFDELVSNYICLLEIIREDWGETAMNVVSEYERADNQSEVAENLDISPQTVSYHIGKPEVNLVLEIEESLSEILYRMEQKYE